MAKKRKKHPEYTKRTIEELSTELEEARNSEPSKNDELGRWLKLYSEREFSIYQLERKGRKYKPRKIEKLAFNVIRSCVDGLTSLLCEKPVNVSYITDGANWPLRKKARKRSKAVLGFFRTNKMVTMTPRIVKHAAISGRGHLHVMQVNGTIQLEVAPFWEVIVNHLKSLSGDPVQKFRARQMMPRQLAAMFPEHKALLMRNPDEPLEFVDEWTLPSTPDAGDGAHAQFVPDLVVLNDVRYEHPRFPVVDFIIDDSPVSYGGSGIPEQIEGIQLEIMSVLETIQNNVFHGGNLKVAIQSGTNATLAGQLSNELGCPIIEYTGDKSPVFSTADMGLSELMGYLEFLERKAFELTGISQMNVQSQTPFASMSGKARIINNQTYNKRFATHQQRFEQFHIDSAMAIMDAAEDLVEAGHDQEISFAGRLELEKIKLSDIAGNDDSFDCAAWTTALAGESPAAQVAYIDQYMSLGMLDLQGALALSDLPYDVQEYVNTILAPKDLAEQMVNRIIEDGEYVYPHPLMDLEYAAQISMLWYNRGVLNDVEEGKLAMLLDFHDNCRLQQPPPMPPMGPEGALPPEQSVAAIQSGGVPL